MIETTIIELGTKGNNKERIFWYVHPGNFNKIINENWGEWDEYFKYWTYFAFVEKLGEYGYWLSFIEIRHNGTKVLFFQKFSE